MLRIPQGIDELATFLMTAHQRGGGRRGHEPDAVTEHLAGSSRRQYLVFGRQRPVDSILVDEIVDALGIEEVLNLLAVLSLPLAVGTAPLIVERDVHGHAPRVITEVGTAVTVSAPAGHRRTVELTHVGIQSRCVVTCFVKVSTTAPGTLVPEVGTAVISPPSPHLVECGDVIAGIGEPLTEAVGCKRDEFRLRIDEKTLPRSLLIAERTKGGRIGIGRNLARHDAVKDMLCLCLVVDSCVVAPTVGSKDQRRDEIELTVRGCSFCISRAVGLAAPGEVPLAGSRLVLHVTLAPSPQAVEDVLLAELHGNHQTVAHALGASIVVLDVRHIAHRVAHFEVDFVGTTKHIVEHLLHLGIDISL